MKELSIEEKAKRYDEAIEKAEVLYKTAEPMSGCNVLLETVFPELAESEDERIRKTLINGFNKLGKSAVWYNGITNAQILDWLEKQGKSALEAAKEEKVDNQNCVKSYAQEHIGDAIEPKFKVGDVVTNKKSKDTVKIVQILHDSYCYSGWNGAATVHSDFSISEQDDWELVEQKSAWSEEDELHIRELESLVKQVWATAEHENDKDTIHKMSDLSFFLKTLKPQPKQEWSEEDENEYAHILKTLNLVAKEQETKGYNNLISSINWLKSLKDRYTWKPSGEQMEAINTAISVLGKSTLNGKQLIEL